jgi:hypothetical protein
MKFFAEVQQVMRECAQQDYLNKYHQIRELKIKDLKDLERN